MHFGQDKKLYFNIMSSAEECCTAMANIVAADLKNKGYQASLFPNDFDNINKDDFSISFSKGITGVMMSRHPILGIRTSYPDNTPIPEVVLLASGLSQSDIEKATQRYKRGGAKRTRKNRKNRKF